MGLTTARLVQEAGFPVTIYAKALPPRHDVQHRRRADSVRSAITARTPLRRALEARSSWRALDYSWRRFQIMVGDDYGVRWLPTYDEVEPPARRGDWMDAYYPDEPDIAAEPSILSRSTMSFASTPCMSKPAASFGR